ncbi:type II toxin-antitoxin system RelE/ParE family toxin [Fodinisporobacter ferrooxydans]|uniref:Type II toxin-antitoxin system RelE/ParE family toxin n=1 Tax=Fodinisporobacter ferrooxydans TaxID=2901836 RepID=A0ABY4CPN8_9BACL|nr:type II toxin-antitoxin system RelE/ParE family toxin [Alicyclobacillaceae bacterium MYW30-H2]
MASTYSSTKKMDRLLKQASRKAPRLYDELCTQQYVIVQNPGIGSYLKGDLQGFQSYDFKFDQVSLRICYLYSESNDHITFVYFGTRENFYDEVKRYLI